MEGWGPVAMSIIKATALGALALLITIAAAAAWIT